MSRHILPQGVLRVLYDGRFGGVRTHNRVMSVKNAEANKVFLGTVRNRKVVLKAKSQRSLRQNQ